MRQKSTVEHSPKASPEKPLALWVVFIPVLVVFVLMFGTLYFPDLIRARN